LFRADARQHLAADLRGAGWTARNRHAPVWPHADAQFWEHLATVRRRFRRSNVGSAEGFALHLRFGDLSRIPAFGWKSSRRADLAPTGRSSDGVLPGHGRLGNARLEPHLGLDLVALCGRSAGPDAPHRV